MSNRPVYTTQKILCLLLESQLSVNKIIGQTSSDKDYVSDLIDRLTKLGLLKEQKDPRHKQKKIKNLTPIGKDMALLFTLINDYEGAEKMLTSQIESFTLKGDISNIAARSRLRNIGWNNDEIIFYPKYIQNSHTLKLHFKRFMYELIQFRYSLVILKYKPNKKLKQLLHEVILSILTQQISEIISYIESMGPPNIATIKTRERIANTVERWNNRFIGKEVKYLESRLIRFLDVPESIKLPIPEYLKDITDIFEDKNISKSPELQALSYLADNFDFDPVSSDFSS